VGHVQACMCVQTGLKLTNINRLWRYRSPLFTVCLFLLQRGNVIHIRHVCTVSAIIDAWRELIRIVSGNLDNPLMFFHSLSRRFASTTLRRGEPKILCGSSKIKNNNSRDVFKRIRIVAKSAVSLRHVCPSDCLSSLRLDGYLWNVMSETYKKYVEQIQI